MALRRCVGAYYVMILMALIKDIAGPRGRAVPDVNKVRSRHYR